MKSNNHAQKPERAMPHRLTQRGLPWRNCSVWMSRSDADAAGCVGTNHRFSAEALVAAAGGGVCCFWISRRDCERGCARWSTFHTGEAAGEPPDLFSSCVRGTAVLPLAWSAGGLMSGPLVDRGLATGLPQAPSVTEDSCSV